MKDLASQRVLPKFPVPCGFSIIGQMAVKAAKKGIDRHDLARFSLPLCR